MQRQAFGRLCFCSIWAAEPDWVRWWMKPVAPHDALWLERSTLRRIFDITMQQTPAKSVVPLSHYLLATCAVMRQRD